MISCPDTSRVHSAWLGMLRTWPFQHGFVSRMQGPAGGPGPHQWALLMLRSGESSSCSSSSGLGCSLCETLGHI